MTATARVNSAITAEDIGWALRIAARYTIASGIAYHTVNHFDVELDVYHPGENTTPKPTLLFMHAGGWAVSYKRSTASLWFLPFLQLGWVVVNVGYRTSALAPAAVQDCLHALHWVTRHGAQYSIDPCQVVLAGVSAGGHLALSTGMIPLAADKSSLLGLEWISEVKELIRPAAIVNWCGITDVADLIEGPHRQEFAVRWLGDQPNRLAVAKAVSPLAYIRAGLPPVITVHGDKDEIVPYDHAARLRDGLSEVGVMNKLITLPEAVHASIEAYLKAYPQILEFLGDVGLTLRPESS